MAKATGTRRIASVGVVAGIAVAAGALWLATRRRGAAEADHETIVTSAALSLRRYPAQIWAVTIQRGTRDEALANGFGLLADYVFAESREGPEVAATGPVFTESAADGAWQIARAMPADATRETLPAPGKPILLRDVAARRLAAIAFPGRATEARLARKESELRRWMERQALVPAGDAIVALYGSPATPGPLRRNAVLIPIA